MKLLILLCLAAGATAYICDPLALCDDRQLCKTGFICAEKDMLGLGRCCIDENNLATDPPLRTLFPIFPTNVPGVTIPNIPMTQPPLIPIYPMTQPPISIFPPGLPNGQCQDTVNPSTGVSDCLARADLCNDSEYYDIMTKDCPKTCGRCEQSYSTIRPEISTRFPFGACRDRLNPVTGQNDCGSKSQLCQNALYKNIMRSECPQTCGFCSSFGSSTRFPSPFTSTSRPGNCQDRLNPKTGRSDCQFNKALCNRSDYQQLMRTECPKTCGFC